MVTESLVQLVERSYPIEVSHFEPMHLFASDERGVYRVDRKAGPPLLLRAARASEEAIARTSGTARSLGVLAAVGCPAPVPQRTIDNELFAVDDTWTAQLLSFIEGDLVSDTTKDMEAMGALLAQLHLLDQHALRSIEPDLPACRWSRDSNLKTWLHALEAIADLVPAALEGRYEVSVASLRNVLSWPELPVALLHGDCNPQNAIRTGPDRVVFIDWDGIGFGPAILDLGYLVFHCHINQQCWPTIEPDPASIRAVLRGYLEVRSLTPNELGHLPSAIAFAECRHLAIALPAAVQDDWKKNRGLTRFYGREQVVPAIAELALAASE